MKSERASGEGEKERERESGGRFLRGTNFGLNLKIFLSRKGIVS